MHAWHAQNDATNSGGQVNQIQPKIIVVPFSKQGEDVRALIESDVNKRIAITKIKEAFDSRGFSTEDFIGKFKPDVVISFLNQYVIFDAKVSKAENLNTYIVI